MLRLLKTMSNSLFWNANQFVWGYWRRFPRVVSALLAGKVLKVTCDVFLPVLAGIMIDAVALDNAQLAPSAEQINYAFLALIGFVGIETFYFINWFWVDKCWIWLASEVMTKMVNDTFYRVQRFSTDWHANSFAGATVRKITRGKWAYDTYADSFFFGILPTTLIIFGMTIMFWVQWALMGLLLLTGIVLLIGMNAVLVTKYIAPANKAFNKKDTQLGAVLADSITCNSVIKSFGAETREDERLHDASNEWRMGARGSWNREVNTHGLQITLMLMMLTGMLGLGIWFWSRGMATPGQVAQVMTSYFVINGYLRHIGMHMRDMQKAINEMEDIIEFMHLPLDIEDRDHATSFVPGPGDLCLENVTFQYENQPTALYDNFSLNIKPGEKVALVGKSGSGKSTFVKLVQRLYDLSAGRITIDGQDIAEVTQSSLREAIALVPQEPILFHRSLQENIAYGRPGAKLDQIIDASKRAHAHEFIEQLKEGYDTLVGERGIKLSGGERQRVALARAFLADCPVLILDEATSSLDSHTEAYIQESMADLMEGRTTIVIAHRLSTIRSVDRILVFDGGRILEQGSHEELMAQQDSHYRSLVAVQMLEETAKPKLADLAS